MLVFAAVLVWRMPVGGYEIACEKSTQVKCALVRDTASGPTTYQVALAHDARAVVRIQPVRRGQPRILLYLHSAEQSIFAAEFESEDRVSDAHTAAARLNALITEPRPGSVLVQTRPAEYLVWGARAGMVLLALLVVVCWHALLARPASPAAGP